MARAVLFDMDGVLAFTEQFYNQRRANYLIRHGFELDAPPDFSGSNDEAIWKELVPDDPRRRELLHRGYREYSAEHPTPWRKVANPFVRCTMWRLRRNGIRIAICSSSSRDLIDDFLEQLDLADAVDLAISGHDCSAFKPSPACDGAFGGRSLRVARGRGLAHRDRGGQGLWRAGVRLAPACGGGVGPVSRRRGCRRAHRCRGPRKELADGTAVTCSMYMTYCQ